MIERRHVVLDVNLLYKSIETDKKNTDIAALASEVLNIILEQSKISIAFDGSFNDGGGAIFLEYSDLFSSGRDTTFVEQWWAQIIAKDGKVIDNLSKSINKSIIKNLNEKKGKPFKVRDYKYVGVAARTNSGMLVTQDNADYCPKVIKYLAKDLKITVTKLKERLKKKETAVDILSKCEFSCHLAPRL